VSHTTYLAREVLVTTTPIVSDSQLAVVIGLVLLAASYLVTLVERRKRAQR
jgi:hypothetical protein